ncbi:GGDEF domain-containing protein [Rhizobiaceae bacterium BDR2-2]|uniref:diguanylate cyclase n=1 Tax=Ectorhizobium quercum TaxID=2965071 RepID=A0AAE3N3C5_9HYPH|nr:GGDEF domain-containing protein [Ectorhizobium quercum]MCX8998939.1 GGDEF domain-containing protein [Ectorhizobium quercum]
MIDVRTGLLMWALEALSLSVVLLALWIGMRRSRTILFWSAGFALHGLGLVGVALRDRIPDFLSIQVANTAALFGMGLLLAGVQALDRRPVSVAIFIPAFVWTGGMLVPGVYETLWARLALYQGAASTAYALIGLALLRGSTPTVNTRTALAALQFVQTALSLAVMTLIVLYRPTAFHELPHAIAIAVTGGLSIIGSLILGTRLMMLENEHRLKRLAETDPLTGVLNRRGFEQAFDRMNGALFPDLPATALVHLDLDHFKRINDLHGHQAGDIVLMAFARMADAVMVGRGVVGRLGGEEFACVLRVASAAEAVEAAGRIREALKQTPVALADSEIAVTTSAGISIAPHGTAGLSAMLAGADRALYAAKRAGRDRIGIECEDGVHIVSASDEAALSDSTDRQVAELQRMRLIGRT